MIKINNKYSINLRTRTVHGPKGPLKVQQGRVRMDGESHSLSQLIKEYSPMRKVKGTRQFIERWETALVDGKNEYKVSNMGRIRRFIYGRQEDAKCLKVPKSGYIKLNGRRYRLARLVAEVFMYQCENLYVIDGNFQNCGVDNLYYTNGIEIPYNDKGIGELV